MEFSDSYFEDEVREGFFVPSMMKRCWAAQIEVLEVIKKICKKYQIQYFAEWGTLLGAIRHKGMIPWDDDLDICMKRRDYEKFLEVAEKELPDGYWIMNYRTYDTDNMISKVSNCKSPLLSEKDLPGAHGYPYTVCVDLFQLDFLPKDLEKQKKFRELIGLVGQINYNIDNGGMKPEELRYCIKGLENIFQVSFDSEKPMKRQLLTALEKAAVGLREEDADEITTMSLYLESGKYHMPKGYYAEAVSMPFENTDIMVPIGYDSLLQKKYGNYMNPIRTWDSHDYPSYKILHEEVKEKLKLEPFQYIFSKDEMEEVKKTRIPKTSLQARAKSFLPLFREAHEELRKKSATGEMESLLVILGECQETAIKLGTIIEEKRGEGHPTVTVLEQYCETLFRIHERLLKQDWSGGDIFFELSIFEKQFYESVEHDLQEKKEVVFVPYKSSHWGTMENMWQAAMEDEDTEVYVVPAPYFYKDDYGKVKSGEPHYESNYPKDVTITSYEEYNFETHHPDIIVTQYPYDEYNYALTIHPFFYSTNLIKYTDRLVYIPPFVMDEIKPEDERGRVTLRYFCNMPGVVHADTVLVQSEQMKEVYVELLTEFAGEDTKKIWENKIVCLGTPLNDYEKKSDRERLQIPEEWKSVLYKGDGSWKKIILYSTSVSTLLQYREQMIDKMREVFELFRKNQGEVALIWRPDRNARDVLRRKHSVLWQRYRDLVQEYKENHIGIYDDSSEKERAVLLCDACYGDGGETLNACRVHKKPVMIQSVL